MRAINSKTFCTPLFMGIQTFHLITMNEKLIIFHLPDTKEKNKMVTLTSDVSTLIANTKP